MVEALAGLAHRKIGGGLLARTGEVTPGLYLILSGEVLVRQHDERAQTPDIVTHRPGSFLGELAQLSDRPALVDAVAVSDVEALVVPGLLTTATLVAPVPASFTVAPERKPVPVMVTAVPPAVVPEFGEIPVTVGAGLLYV